MTVSIKSLGIKKAGERQIREIVNSPTGSIEIYEPTLEDIQRIIDIQAENSETIQNDKVVFNGQDVIKLLFPLLTNIDFSEITDEELEEIIENPTVHLLITQQIVAQIVSEANKLYAQRMRSEIANTESTLAQMELIKAIPSVIVESAKRDGKVAELTQRLDEVNQAVDEAMAKEAQEGKQDGETA